MITPTMSLNVLKHESVKDMGPSDLEYYFILQLLKIITEYKLDEHNSHLLAVHDER